MAENSKISWTDHTFNPWIGCTKVSPGCKNCYAETMMDHRYGKVKWGPRGLRVRTSKTLWAKPLQWNKAEWRECLDCGYRGVVGSNEPYYLCRCGSRNNKPTRQRIFCASLADIFEHKEDQLADMNQWRADLFKIVEDTPNLDWLLLTKRIENVDTMMPITWYANFPKNVWLGTSIENQEEADARLPFLERLGRYLGPSVIFVSAEPLLSAIDISDYLKERDFVDEDGSGRYRAIDWVIAGGESGPKARPMHSDWVRSLRDQCQIAGIPYHFKQWGEYAPYIPREDPQGKQTVLHVRLDGEKYNPEDFSSPIQSMARVGKHAAGRMIDGREWNEFPSNG
jgi:protein gp37